MIDSNHRKKLTKIVCTVSDMRCDPVFIKDLFESGMDVVRLNTAHQTPEGTLVTIKNVRQVSERIPLMLDTKGPEVRTRPSAEPHTVKIGDIITIRGDEKDSVGANINVNYNNFAKDIPVGARVLIEEGKIVLLVKEKKDDSLICVSETNGAIKAKKQVNVPGVKLNQPTLSKKDMEYIEFACQHDLDFIAHSFVRNKQDVLTLQAELDKRNSKIKIIAKIENQEGIDNIDEILDHVYGVMVARGDLGVEVPAAQVPMVQKMLIKKCIKRAKPVIVATHMLESMIKNASPTRAEVSDVANAILDGTSALMLSGETAYGDFPLEAVRTMASISKELEYKKSDLKFGDLEYISDDQTTIMAKSAIAAAVSLNAAGIVVPTLTGNAARILSSFRSKKRIFAKCYDKRVMRELALSYGVSVSFFENGHKTMDHLVADGLSQLIEAQKLVPEDLVVIFGRTPGHQPTHANFLEVSTVKECLLRGKK
ncbi:MAG TPA: pyruvate kinase [Acidobacteriota bacterium]|nr:pyruvate kinase [Acidobacteriota bacterium]